MSATATIVVLVFRDVGQMRKVRKSPHDRIGLVACEFFQQLVEIGGSGGILLAAKAHGSLTYRFDDLEDSLPFLVANYVAKQPT